MIALNTDYLAELSEHYAQDEGVQLMIRLRAGDDSVLQLLVEKYRPLIAVIVREILGSEEHLDDISQEVFLRVFRARQRYEPTAKLATWLSLIARNLAFNLKRDCRKRRTVNWDFADPAEPTIAQWGSNSTSGPDGHAISNELSQALHRAVDRLIPRQQEAVRLVYLSGMSYAQAASQMRTSPNAVKAILSRARAHLKCGLAGTLSP